MDSRGAENRQRIVDAARDLFYEKGYIATSFTDIARAADIPRGNFYYYFKTKDEILIDVIKSRLETLQKKLLTLDRTVSDPRERLLRFISIPILEEEHIIRFGCPLGTLITEIGKSKSSKPSRAVALFDEFLGWLERQFSNLDSRNDPRMLAMHLLGRLQGATILTHAYRDSFYLHYEVEKLRDWILKL